MSENIGNINETGLISGYKKTAFMVGLYVTVFFLLRFAAGIVIDAVCLAIQDSVSYSTLYIIQLSLSGLFLQILPSVIGALMFGWLGKLGSLYRKPKNMLKAVSNFAAVYGMSQIINIITMIIVAIISSAIDIDKTINSAIDTLPFDMPSALFMFFMLVVIAPVFEEFIFRGVIMHALMPYGNGLAIIASGVLFGLFHGNFRQVFYAAVIGIALGYIANVTGSLLPTLIIHAIVNGISGVLLLLLATDGVQKLFTKALGGGLSEEELLAQMSETDMIQVAVFALYLVCVLVFAIVGIITAIIKLKKLKRYKVPKVCPEISNGKKTLMLLTSAPSLVAIALIICTFAGVASVLSEFIFG